MLKTRINKVNESHLSSANKTDISAPIRKRKIKINIKGFPYVSFSLYSFLNIAIAKLTNAIRKQISVT